MGAGSWAVGGLRLVVAPDDGEDAHAGDHEEGRGGDQPGERAPAWVPGRVGVSRSWLMASSRSRATCAGSGGRQGGGGVVRAEPVEQLGRPGRGRRSSLPPLVRLLMSGSRAGLSQLLPELLAGPVQPDAHGVGRDVEDVRDLGRRQLLPGPQAEQLGVLLGAARRSPRRGRGRRPLRDRLVAAAGRRRRSWPRAAPGGVRPGSRWRGSCGPRRRPRGAAPPGRRRAGASRRGASRRARRRPSPRRYDGRGTAAGGRRARGRAPRTAPAWPPATCSSRCHMSGTRPDPFPFGGVGSAVPEFAVMTASPTRSRRPT